MYRNLFAHSPDDGHLKLFPFVWLLCIMLYCMMSFQTYSRIYFKPFWALVLLVVNFLMLKNFDKHYAFIAILFLQHLFWKILSLQKCWKNILTPLESGILFHLHLSFSLFSNKLCFSGVGAIYIRRRPRVRVEALQSGGGQERGMRSGTVPTPLVVGLGAACEVAQQEMEVWGEQFPPTTSSPVMGLLLEASCHDWIRSLLEED